MRQDHLARAPSKPIEAFVQQCLGPNDPIVSLPIMAA
jgi:hypothetical protein